MVALSLVRLDTMMMETGLVCNVETELAIQVKTQLTHSPDKSRIYATVSAWGWSSERKSYPKKWYQMAAEKNKN